MTVRTAPAPSRSEVPALPPSPAPLPTRLPLAPSAGPDPALDEALDHISDLAERLWAVRRLHPVVSTRTLFGRRRRCAGCGHAAPCPTLRAASPS